MATAPVPVKFLQAAAGERTPIPRISTNVSGFCSPIVKETLPASVGSGKMLSSKVLSRGGVMNHLQGPRKGSWFGLLAFTKRFEASGSTLPLTCMRDGAIKQGTSDGEGFHTATSGSGHDSIRPGFVQQDARKQLLALGLEHGCMDAAVALPQRHVPSVLDRQNPFPSSSASVGHNWKGGPTQTGPVAPLQSSALPFLHKAAATESSTGAMAAQDTSDFTSTSLPASDRPLTRSGRPLRRPTRQPGQAVRSNHAAARAWPSEGPLPAQQWTPGRAGEGGRDAAGRAEAAASKPRTNSRPPMVRYGQVARRRPTKWVTQAAVGKRDAGRAISEVDADQGRVVSNDHRSGKGSTRRAPESSERTAEVAEGIAADQAEAGGSVTEGLDNAAEQLQRLNMNEKNADRQSSSETGKLAQGELDRRRVEQVSVPAGEDRRPGLVLMPSSAGPVVDRVLSLDSAAAGELVMEQRSEEWFALRKWRLTASAFGNAVGFWKGGRMQLWEEKLGLREPFRGNEATVWGTKQESGAVERYKEITGHTVTHQSFQVYREPEDAYSWLGASPDGLLEGDNAGVHNGPGVLEVKCPHNRGDPLSARPYPTVPFYYMPQCQGLMEIFGRDWLDFFVWTVKGSAVYRVERNPEYWAKMYQVLSHFWWQCVIPAKHEMEGGVRNADELRRLCAPYRAHPLAEDIVQHSKRLALASKLVWAEDGRTVSGPLLTPRQ